MLGRRLSTLTLSLRVVLSLGCVEQEEPQEPPSHLVAQSINQGDTVPAPTAEERGFVKHMGCSGTMINNFWMLTAAHCLEDETRTGADIYFDRDFNVQDSRNRFGGRLLTPDPYSTSQNLSPYDIKVVDVVSDIFGGVRVVANLAPKHANDVHRIAVFAYDSTGTYDSTRSRILVGNLKHWFATSVDSNGADLVIAGHSRSSFNSNYHSFLIHHLDINSRNSSKWNSGQPFDRAIESSSSTRDLLDVRLIPTSGQVVAGGYISRQSTEHLWLMKLDKTGSLDTQFGKPQSSSQPNGLKRGYQTQDYGWTSNGLQRIEALDIDWYDRSIVTGITMSTSNSNPQAINAALCGFTENGVINTSYASQGLKFLDWNDHSSRPRFSQGRTTFKVRSLEIDSPSASDAGSGDIYLSVEASSPVAGVPPVMGINALTWQWQNLTRHSWAGRGIIWEPQGGFRPGEIILNKGTSTEPDRLVVVGAQCPTPTQCDMVTLSFDAQLGTHDESYLPNGRQRFVFDSSQDTTTVAGGIDFDSQRRLLTAGTLSDPSGVPQLALARLVAPGNTSYEMTMGAQKRLGDLAISHPDVDVDVMLIRVSPDKPLRVNGLSNGYSQTISPIIRKGEPIECFGYGRYNGAGTYGTLHRGEFVLVETSLFNSNVFEVMENASGQWLDEGDSGSSCFYLNPSLQGMLVGVLQSGYFNQTEQKHAGRLTSNNFFRSWAERIINTYTP